jgi:NAD(P)-dependent dehydrogenase (short-subunit alcohol dehydrogenase family)
VAAGPVSGGRVVWITGASSGIGRALALRLARGGDRVAISARRADELHGVARGPAGAALHPFPLDVTDLAAASGTVGAIEQRLGPIDVAVLAAGTHHPVAAEDFSAGDLARLQAVNLQGVANCLEPLIRRMSARRSGRIAIVSSLAGYRGLPSAAYYGASKAGLINLAEALKFDLDRAGVALQLINPGFVRTPLTDRNRFRMPFLIEPEDAAERIARGLGSQRFEIAFPRRLAVVLKLMRCLPYPLYFRLAAWRTGRSR